MRKFTVIWRESEGISTATVEVGEMVDIDQIDTDKWVRMAGGDPTDGYDWGGVIAGDVEFIA